MKSSALNEAENTLYSDRLQSFCRSEAKARELRINVSPDGFDSYLHPARCLIWDVRMCSAFLMVREVAGHGRSEHGEAGARLSQREE